MYSERLPTEFTLYLHAKTHGFEIYTYIYVYMYLCIERDYIDFFFKSVFTRIPRNSFKDVGKYDKNALKEIVIYCSKN